MNAKMLLGKLAALKQAQTDDYRRISLDLAKLLGRDNIARRGLL
jgi:hypothetical protein